MLPAPITSRHSTSHRVGALSQPRCNDCHRFPCNTMATNILESFPHYKGLAHIDRLPDRVPLALWAVSNPRAYASFDNLVQVGKSYIRMAVTELVCERDARSGSAQTSEELEVRHSSAAMNELPSTHCRPLSPICLQTFDYMKSPKGTLPNSRIKQQRSPVEEVAELIQ